MHCREYYDLMKKNKYNINTISQLIVKIERLILMEEWRKAYIKYADYYHIDIRPEDDTIFAKCNMHHAIYLKNNNNPINYINCSCNRNVYDCNMKLCFRCKISIINKRISFAMKENLIKNKIGFIAIKTIDMNYYTISILHP